MCCLHSGIFFVHLFCNNLIWISSARCCTNFDVLYLRWSPEMNWWCKCGFVWFGDHRPLSATIMGQVNIGHNGHLSIPPTSIFCHHKKKNKSSKVGYDKVGITLHWRRPQLCYDPATQWTLHWSCSGVMLIWPLWSFHWSWVLQGGRFSSTKSQIHKYKNTTVYKYKIKKLANTQPNQK